MGDCILNRENKNPVDEIKFIARTILVYGFGTAIITVTIPIWLPFVIIYCIIKNFIEYFWVRFTKVELIVFVAIFAMIYVLMHNPSLQLLFN